MDYLLHITIRVKPSLDQARSERFGRDMRKALDRATQGSVAAAKGAGFEVLRTDHHYAAASEDFDDSNLEFHHRNQPKDPQ